MTEKEMREAKMRVVMNWSKYRNEWQRRFDNDVHYWIVQGFTKQDALYKAMQDDSIRLAALDSWNPTPEAADEE